MHRDSNERCFYPGALLMQPYFSPRPWGGTRLASVLRKSIPVELQSRTEPIGEAWELSDHPHGHSRIADHGDAHPFAGEDFGALLQRFPREMCGVDAAPERYPLLIKYVDAGKDLSIQVHPNDQLAAEAGDRGKDECWLVLDCEPGAEVIHGLCAGTTEADLRAAAANGHFERCVLRKPIRRGDFINVPTGTVHAILGGTLMCEVQRSSDLTYRLWDYNRQPARELHIEAGLRATHFGASESNSRAEWDNPASHVNTSEYAHGEWHRLVRNPYFTVELARWSGGEAAQVARKNPHGLIVCVVSGSGEATWSADGYRAQPLQMGQTWFLTAGLEKWSVRAAAEGLGLLVSESLEW